MVSILGAQMTIWLYPTQITRLYYCLQLLNILQNIIIIINASILFY
jgi:hypothetical protein